MSPHTPPSSRADSAAPDASLFKDTPWPLGVSSTVYSMVWPETEALARESFASHTEALLDRHRQPWLKRQDPMHADFFAAYERFAAPALLGGARALEAFAHRYPCAGASEAIRESVHQLGTLPQKPAMLVFDGEYEGYEAMGAIDGLSVKRLNRERWREELALFAQTGERASFFISQPSAIDGSEWSELPAFLDEVAKIKDRVDVRLDLTYVGATASLSPVPADHPAVSQIFFSLSKPFGCYYRRIGGCYSREPIPSLWGNGWFKNLDALSLGEALLNSEPSPFARHQRWAPLQEAAVERANQTLADELASFGARVEAADSILLARVVFDTPEGAQRFSQARQSEQPSSERALARLACRGSDPAAPASYRLCLTPWMETLLSLDPRFGQKPPSAPAKARKP